MDQCLIYPTRDGRGGLRERVGRRGRRGRGLLRLELLADAHDVASGVICVQQRERNDQHEEGDRRILGRLGEHIAGPRADQRVHRATAEGRTRHAGVLFRQLHQDEQAEKQTVEHEDERKDVDDYLLHKSRVKECS